MDMRRHLAAAMQAAADIPDWEHHGFDWHKAYVAAVFSALAYEAIPEFELKKSRRAKVIPSDRYQAHISRWEMASRPPPALRELGELGVDLIVRRRVVVAITALQNVIFVSLRGTTISFADIMADIDIRKVKYSLGFGESMRLHRGFFDAVLECFDEVIDTVAARRQNNSPIYITGHSLGGAMAAVFQARLAEAGYHPLFRPRVYRIPPATACYTFGMPRYQDMVAKAMLPQPFHVFNELDAVPTVPPTMLGFVDAPNERCLNAIPALITVERKGNLALRADKRLPTVLGGSDHRMERYVDRVEAMHLLG